LDGDISWGKKANFISKSNSTAFCQSYYDLISGGFRNSCLKIGELSIHGGVLIFFRRS
jgi:hypothetical protein